MVMMWPFRSLFTLSTMAASVVDFARSRGTRDQDETAWTLGQLAENGRQPQFLEGHDIEGNQSNRQRHTAALAISVAAEARQVLNPEREIQLVLLFEPFLLALGQDRIGQL